MLVNKFLRRDIAIDLGTANTLIFVKGQGIVLNEPSVLALRHGAQANVGEISVGHEAKSMLGRAPENIQAVCPIKEGVITDFSQTTQMVKAFMEKVLPSGMFRPGMRITISVPCDATQVERRALREAAMSTGANEVSLIEAPMAAALGAGLPIAEAKASMVMDIGAGTTELAVIALCGVVHKLGLRMGGNSFDEAIAQHVRRQHGLAIGERTAERIKLEMGNALPSDGVDEMEITGQKVSEGVPRSVQLTSSEVFEAITEPLAQIVDAVKMVLEKLPAEVAADIAESGIVLSGGGALLRNLDQLLAAETGLSIRIADEPMSCVVRGTGMAMSNMADLAEMAVQE